MSTKTIADRLSEWQLELLDLSNRNKLLNFKHSVSRPSSVRLVAPPATELFRSLYAEERTLRVLGTEPADGPEGLIEDELPGEAPLLSEWERNEEYAITAESEPLPPGSCRADFPIERANKVLGRLSKRARSSELEQGVSILYTAFGRLKWKEKPGDETARFAPLVLLPVRIEVDTKTQGFKLFASGDDPEFNLTLVQRMSRDFGIEMGQLSESVADLADVFQTVRQLISRQAEWEVVEDAHISLFQFHKLRMFQDLAEHADVAVAHPIVRALGEEGLSLDSSSEQMGFDDSTDYDAKPEDTFSILDADSSQLAAIRSAKMGASFVIDGPPGTGKSQTIANIIAENIAEGKTVLFVSEKSAAIEVVHRRLTNRGLGDFCLMLHSQKANKRDVVVELGNQLDRHKESARWFDEAKLARLVERRQQLNAYVEALHRNRSPLERSVYSAVSELAPLANAPRLAATPPNVTQLTAEKLQRWRDRIAAVERWNHVFVEGSLHPWVDLKARTVSLAQREEIERTLTQLGRSIDAMGTVATETSRWLAVNEADTLFDVRAQARLLSNIPRDQQLQSHWFGAELPADSITLLGEAIERAELIRKNLDQISTKYDLRIVELASPDVVHTFNAGVFSRLFSSSFKRSRAELRALAVDPNTHNLAAERESLRVASEVRSLRGWFETNAQVLATCVGGRADPKGLWSAEILREAHSGIIATYSIVQSAEGVADRRTLANVLAQPNAGVIAAAFSDRFKAALESYDSAVGTLSSYFDVSAFGRQERRLDDVARWVFQKLQRFSAIDDWLRAVEARDAAYSDGLGAIVSSLLEDRVSAGEWDAALRRLVLTHWLSSEIQEDPVLRSFSVPDHEAAIADFRQLDEAFVQNNPHRLRAKLAHSTVTVSGSTSGEPGILLREFHKKRAHVPLRRLFPEIPNLLPKLKPCLMMSPLSVASFLPADRFRFDLVIFDEASQVRPHDAVGAIMRGKQLIVAGDENQLPPTSFFDRVASDDTVASMDDQDLRSFDSVLKALKGRGMPVRPEHGLQWHYRSRHEHLIAFSNAKIYDGRLITFPNPSVDRDPDRGVHFEYVPDGVYHDERDAVLKTPLKVNRREARRVAQLVMDHARTRPGESLLVVTLGSTHRDVVEEEIESARSLDRSLESFFDPANEEPFVVKALEQVQGDERDVIIISIGFGKDASGKLSHFFGPISQQGGQRRLNVLVTRARSKIVVVSSIRASDLDESRMGAAGGARLLKQYLDFAERGPIALESASRITGGDFESPFEDEVGRALAQLGYRVERQIGCSGFRIDLAIVDPRHPGRFLLGIECDGATYHRSKNARDRDRLRQQILEGFGWSIHRVWSTEWMRDRGRELDRISQRIETLLNDEEPGELPDPDVGVESASDRTGAAAQPSSIPDSPAIPNYQIANINGFGDLVNDPLTTVVKDVVRCVSEEGPVHVELVRRRVANGWGIQRIGSRVAAKLDLAVSAAVREKAIERRGEFLWAPGQQASLRGPADDGWVRDVVHIPDEEVMEAYRLSLQRSLSLSEEELVSQSARLFGYQRTGSEIQQRMRGLIAVAEASGVLRRRNGRCELAD